MKFVDEVEIIVASGKGGDGCMGFRREKFIPFGGPDGGNGGKGGSVYLVGDENINTLVDFRHRKNHKAENGQQGGGNERTGQKGEHLYLKVPVGTQVSDADTGEIIGDLSQHEKQCIVARGGDAGLGNTHFKSSTNRSPRKIVKGQLGEQRKLLLELKVMADVGLLGMPNAGKSTFLRAVSAARPKVAAYPFTTLYPNLGVVDVGDQGGFVIADIPGLVEGAAEGAGLGIRFLKHLSRTRLLLHLVDVAPYSGSEDPVKAISSIEKELHKYSEELASLDRWLVFNKLDLVNEQEADSLCADIVQQLNWKGPVYQVAAIKKKGTKTLCNAIDRYLLEKKLEQSEQETM